MQCQDTSGIEGRFRRDHEGENRCQIKVKDQETQQMCVAVKAPALQQELIACMHCRQVELFFFNMDHEASEGRSDSFIWVVIRVRARWH